MSERIYLSPPHMSGEEIQLVQQVFTDNWIAPVGPQLNAFEKQFREYVGAEHAVALSSGTAGLHLALIATGIGSGDEVLVSSLTFSASVNPILYVGAKPTFIDSEWSSWNIDPNLLEDTLRKRAQAGKLPKAVLPVHLYGQTANMQAIMEICDRYGVIVIEDAAEALGSHHYEQHPGTFGKVGIFSFNGNKIITTSGGGMLVTNDKDIADHVRKLSTQAREPAPHYEHNEIGYNYRLSNVLAAIGIGQMNILEERVHRKREIFDYYRSHLGHLPGLNFVDEIPNGRHTRWLSVVLVDAKKFGVDAEQIRLTLEEHNIESRPLWKPMHLQPIFKAYESIGGAVAESLFEQGLCLPSGTALTEDQLEYIVSIIQDLHQA